MLPFIAFQAALSAKVLLFAYAPIFRLMSDQSLGPYLPVSFPAIIAKVDEVSTSLFTPALLAALITRRVPSTAGVIKRFSSYGSFKKNGDAIWRTYEHPFIASVQPLSESKSVSTKDKLFIFATWPIVFRVASAFERDRTAPITSYP